MILPESLHPDWINSNREKFHADPIIIEKVVASTNFIKWDEKIRSPKSGIEKRHFKLFYTPTYSYDPSMYRLQKQKGGTFKDYKDKTYLKLDDYQLSKQLFKTEFSCHAISVD